METSGHISVRFFKRLDHILHGNVVLEELQRREQNLILLGSWSHANHRGHSRNSQDAVTDLPVAEGPEIQQWNLVALKGKLNQPAHC